MSNKSQSEKKLKWCLNKAEKEIEKGQKHRGLIKIQPNLKLAKAHLKKAEHNLKAFLDNTYLKNYDWAINMGFYALYHCCLAIAIKFGYESRNQECTLSLIKYLAEENKIPNTFMEFVDEIKNQDNENEILQMREKYQYTPSVSIDIKKLENLEKMCKIVIQETKGLLV